jgi:hypothetical protein
MEPKASRYSIFISDKEDFKPKLVRMYKRRSLHIDKGNGVAG